MNDAHLTFSCVLPTYNRAETVERTLRQLIACDYPNDSYEILVADNSSDRTPAMVEELARSSAVPIRLLHSSERLPAVKRNDAVRVAEGDYIILMNDDVWVRPNFLMEHERAQRQSRGPTAVLGHVEQSLQMEQTPFTQWYRPFAYQELAGRAGSALEWYYFWSINLSLPRSEMIDRNLMFHEDWAEIGHEDVELGYRWTKAGNAIVYNPAAWGEHYHPHTLESACRLQDSIGRGLRDLVVVVPEPGLLERYGVWSRHNSPRGIARGAIRQAAFNPITIPYAKRVIERQPANSRLAHWMYWKVLLHYTNRGYRQAPVRQPDPLPTRPPVREGDRV